MWGSRSSSASRTTEVACGSLALPRPRCRGPCASSACARPTTRPGSRCAPAKAFGVLAAACCGAWSAMAKLAGAARRWLAWPP
eukprot:1998170-Lingulodinium_polyedra.AAC.1